VQLCSGLTIELPIVGNKHRQTVSHLTALFGRQEYDLVSKEIVISTVEPTFCLANSTLHGEGKVLVVLRGSCTFYAKAQNAQRLGFVAVIIGDNNEQDSDSIPRMGSTVPDNLNIPVVAISYSSYVLLSSYDAFFSSQQRPLVVTLNDEDSSINPDVDEPTEPFEHAQGFPAFKTVAVAICLVLVGFVAGRKCCKHRGHRWHRMRARLAAAQNANVNVYAPLPRTAVVEPVPVPSPAPAPAPASAPSASVPMEIRYV